MKDSIERERGELGPNTSDTVFCPVVSSSYLFHMNCLLDSWFFVQESVSDVRLGMVGGTSSRDPRANEIGVVK